MQIFLWVAAAWWLLALFLVWQYQFSKITQLINARWLKSLMGFLILLPTWFALSHLHQSRGGDWLLFLLVLIWTADSGAYFAGRRWGKHKLAKRVSPGKTWEGVAGAVVSSLLLTLLWLWWSNLAMPAALWLLLLSVLTVLASILGDLLESLFKRQTGIKDSSQLLPGHGGILDRIDSLTAAAPIFVLGLGFIL
ncbi:phosphatidate cytidylyltransferase [Candidatus Venteria ishoeyi]|uniref:Phosphatidate cytidylyltransferase n=2 Tax=Candidatus Venteria ishoeyi TaxID=1899563 RepID=A0A1H6F960_9GAMM|nr:phosphatidate cytidylyltransferase [Candidatus Venteria ishoeyi]SEH05941.1 Phosphatidate cytidylyltransferase [Candidatus Venteria ishoeyi]